MSTFTSEQKITDLIAEYGNWGRANGFTDDGERKLLSADEMVAAYPDLTAEQRKWLTAFSDRWVAAQSDDDRVEQEVEFFVGKGFTWEYPGFLAYDVGDGFFTVGIDTEGEWVVQCGREDGGDIDDDLSPICKDRDEVLEALQKARVALGVGC